MKSKEEIEQLAQEVHYEFQNQGLDADGCFNQYQGFIKGYNQCQEDIKPLLKNLFDLWETLAKCGEIGVGIDFTKHYERLKQQLNKQD